MYSLMRNLKNTGLVYLLILLLSQCTSIEGILLKVEEEQKITANPSPLEYYLDSVKFDLEIEFPKSVSIGTDARYDLRVIYHPTKGDSVTIDQVPLTQFLINKEEKVTHSVQIPYKPEWKYGEVLVQGQLIKQLDTAYTHLVKVADGIITTSSLVQPAYYLHSLPHGYKPVVEYEEKTLTILFQDKRKYIGKEEKEQETLQVLEDFIAQNAINGEIDIIAMHSPSKEESSSKNFADERAEATKQLIKEIYAKYPSSKAPKINTRSIFQDWSYFSKELNADTLLTEKQKEEVLAMIDGGGDFAKKDLAFKKLKYYKNLKKGVYARLRRTNLTINVPKKQLSDAEIVLTAKKVAEGKINTKELKAGELLLAAEKTPDLAEKQKIYEATVKEYKSVVAHNNLAQLYLEASEGEDNQNEKLKLVEKAILQLKAGLKIKKQPELLLNLAAAQIIKKDQDAAIQTILDVPDNLDSTFVSSVNALKGYVYLKRGNYSAAIKQFSLAGNSSEVLFDKGMSYLLYASFNQLKSAYPSAERAFINAIKADPDNAYAYYGAAITAARLEDERIMGKYLKEACKRSPELRERAKTDLEFAPFRMNESYKMAFEQ